MKKLYREKLDQLFEKTLDFPVTFISAPVGWGKSQAVYAYLEKRGTPSMWISADEFGREDIMRRIWDGISRFCDPAREMPESIPGWKEAVREMKLPSAFALVMDDCPAPLPGWAMDLLEVFQKARVPGLNIYVISRRNLSRGFSAK